MFHRIFRLIGVSLIGICASANSFAQVAPLTQTVGKYSVTLRIPAAGLFAEEPVDIEFRLADTSNNDPVLGAVGVVRAVTKASVTMPAMAGMPAQTPKIHSEGVPGDYGIESYFPHGGAYRIDLALVPPGETKALNVHFTVEVKDAQLGKKPRPKPFYVELEKSGAAEAGKDIPLKLTIRETATKAIVSKFDVAHTKLFHLIIVSKDLGWFAHEHPEQQADGSFTINQVFPAGGMYRVFADVAPAGAGSQVVSTTINVTGPASTWDSKLVSTTAPVSVGGVIATLSSNSKSFAVGTSAILGFKLKDTASGVDVTDLEPYLGAMGHLILIHQDGQSFVHSHPLEDDASVAKSKSGDVGFTVRIPRPGLYKGWAQFQRKGVVITMPFVLSVKG